MGEKTYGVVFIIIALLTGIIWALGMIALIVYWGEFDKVFLGWTNLGPIPIPPLIVLTWLPAFLAVILVDVILAWVGIALVRTPSLEEIDVEELEKEIEEEAKKLEEQS